MRWLAKWRIPSDGSRRPGFGSFLTTPPTASSSRGRQRPLRSSSTSSSDVTSLLLAEDPPAPRSRGSSTVHSPEQEAVEALAIVRELRGESGGPAHGEEQLVGGLEPGQSLALRRRVTEAPRVPVALEFVQVAAVAAGDGLDETGGVALCGRRPGGLHDRLSPEDVVEMLR